MPRPRRTIPTFAVTAVLALVTSWAIWHPLLIVPHISVQNTGWIGYPPDSPYLKRITSKIPGRTPLSGVLDRLTALTGVDISVNWPALESVGVRPDTPVNVYLPKHDVPLQYILDSLDYSAGPIGYRRLAHQLHGGVIRVSTADDLAPNETTSRTYDLRPLLDPRFPSFLASTGKWPTASPTAAEDPYDLGRIDRLLRPGPSDPQARGQALASRVTGSIAPTSWREIEQLHGKTWDYDPIRGQLTVVQTEANHRAIRDHLQRLQHRDGIAAFAGRTLTLLLLALLTTATAPTALRLLRRRRKPAGLCAHCGYDLRATPDRCPQCGQVPDHVPA